MTTEYTPGSEDIGVLIFPKADGMVALRIITLGEDPEVLTAIALPPEVARNCAQKLTLSSWKAEAGKGTEE